MITITVLNEDVAEIFINGERLLRGARTFTAPCDFTAQAIGANSAVIFAAFCVKERLSTSAKGVTIFSYKERAFILFDFAVYELGEATRQEKIDEKQGYTLFSGENEAVMLETESAYARVQGGGALVSVTKRGDYVVVAFEKKLAVYGYTNDYEQLFFEDYSGISEQNKKITVELRYHSTEGYAQITTLSFFPTFSLSRAKKRYSTGNYSKNTLKAAFFECLLYGDDGGVSEFFSEGIKPSEVKDLRKFIGDFDDILLYDDVYVVSGVGATRSLKRYELLTDENGITDVEEM